MSKQYICVTLDLGSLELEWKKRIAFLILLVMLFPNPGCCQPFILLLWGSIASSCTTAPVFSAELFSVQLPSSFYWCMSLFLPRYRTLHFPVWNFCSISIFAEGELGPVVQVINEEVKECWSSLYPWAAALMPGFQLGNALPIPAPGTLPFIQACSLPPRPAWPLLHPPVCVCEDVVGHGVVSATKSSSQRKLSGQSDIISPL